MELVNTLMGEGCRTFIMRDFNMDVRNGCKRFINELKKRGMTEQKTLR